MKYVITNKGIRITTDKGKVITFRTKQEALDFITFNFELFAKKDFKIHKIKK